jgi:2-dehydro-3-deoxyphosphogluconate aldolase/(4S)-4-hydroxy-2-oxoglutarate aldolase
VPALKKSESSRHSVQLVEDALFAAEAVAIGGIPVAEVTMTGGIGVSSQLASRFPDMVVGVGTVLDTDTARGCLDAGARVLSSPGLVMEVVEFALRHDNAFFPGALTPTEVTAAWRCGDPRRADP